MAQPELCPDCGSEFTRGICPRCLIGLGLNGPGLSLSKPSMLALSVRSDRDTTRAGVLESLGVTAGPMPRVLLRDTEDFSGPGPIVQPGSPEMPDLTERGGRFQLFGEIARGGMGAVLKGRDIDLGRDLAVKVLLERHGNDPRLLKRFVEEAQIAGQLQHPGVVPVYELGTFADSRPYFAMKLVKGRTLAEVMAERSKPSDDHPRLLAIFLDIAQTMAYAHARGVIHRDLKPSNVMVGSFGEVQVMDWGLAKVLPRGGVVDDREAGQENIHETVIATARSGSGADSDLSHAGSVLGTPSYMAPEQARGENDHVDERADVFALGSILCEILTGRPAFTGRSSGSILRQAARGDLSGAWKRLEACGADAELIDLVRAALAPEAEDRPLHAGAIVERVSGYLAGVQARLLAAERDRAVAQAQAIEERRRRKLQAALAASILALATVGGLGVAAYFQQRQARAAAVAKLLGEAEILLARASEKPEETGRWREAKAAVGRVGTGPVGDPSATARLEKIKAEAEAGFIDAERDAALRQALVEVRVARVDVGWTETDASYARAFRSAGLDFETLEVAEAVSRLKKRPLNVVTELVGYLDHWISVRVRARRPADELKKLQAIAIAADADPFRSRVRTILASKEGPARASELRAMANDPRSGEQTGPTTVLLASSLTDLNLSIDVLRKAVARHPDDVWLNYFLADTLNHLSPPPREEVIRYYTAARACRPEVGSNLALVLENMGRMEEAEAIYRDLVERRPDTVANLLILAKFLEKRLGRVKEPEELKKKAALRSQSGIAVRPGDVEARVDVGDMLVSQGKMDEAIATLREVVRLKPKDHDAHLNLGIALGKQDKLDEAVLELREVTRLAPAFARGHNNLGYVLRKQGKLDEAVAEFEEAVRLTPYVQAVTNLVEALREVVRLRPNDLEAHTRLGRALKVQGREEEAIEEFRGVLRLKSDDAGAHEALGEALQSQNKMEEAIAELREAIRLQPDLVSAHNCLGMVMMQLGKVDEAIAAYRESTRIRPDQVSAHNSLATNLVSQGKLGEAVAEYREVIRLKPDDSTAHYNLGLYLSRLGKIDDAIAEYRAAVRLKPDHVLARSNLGTNLMKQGKLDDAIAAYREAGRLAPTNSPVYHNLGICLARLGKFDDAIAAHRKAIQIRPDQIPVHNSLGKILKSQGNLMDAFTEFNESARLAGIRPDPSIWELGDVLRALDRHEEAIAAYRRAQEIGKANPAEVAKADKRIATTELRVSLIGRLDAFLKGDDRPKDAVEILGFAGILADRTRYDAAVRAYAEAFAADPRLVEGHRYDAACFAAMAGAGLGKDDPKSGEDARARSRRQALDWLRAELAIRASTVRTGKPEEVNEARQKLLHWKTDLDLAGVRDVLAQLPEAERKDWQAFWAEVEALLTKGE